jgi:hypothetical protein
VHPDPESAMRGGGERDTWQALLSVSWEGGTGGTGGGGVGGVVGGEFGRVSKPGVGGGRGVSGVGEDTNERRSEGRRRKNGLGLSSGGKESSTSGSRQKTGERIKVSKARDGLRGGRVVG